ncbi:OmpW/AlkL family protein [Pseudorhodoferax soli]|uniref:Outer membrane protein n=1 Tax=Pseudorhodoferax soli TaxID=545864 RepID=A0A368Y3V2_9BURK|nr:OmpW family outer membrane protein [Pseudorhodoferax soli]RCW74036.1 outer membrane protein [Pseudorhodoferax soli]
MNKPMIAAAVLGLAMAAPAFAQSADAGPWQVRLRAVHLNSDNGDSTGLGLSINDKTIPEVDISYFFTPHIAAELVLTIPQKHDLRAGGATVGTLRHLPPTLTAQYHFNPGGSVRPYVGAGVNYTRFSSVHLPPGVDIDRSSFGGALQVGVDIPLPYKNLVLNFDIKKLWLGTDVKVAGAKVGQFDVDPVLFGVGLGWRF